jgi:lipopolysaccharide transport system ATP-binding protein
VVSLQFANVGFTVRQTSTRKPMFAKRSRRPVLQSVSLNLTSGMRCALIGPNGSGKTTFLRLASEIYSPTTGSISVNGRVAAVIDPMCHIEPLLTGRRNTSSLLHLQGVARSSRDDLVDFVANHSDLGRQFDDSVGTYSVGMQWKLALWSVLAARPEIILIDEGIATLDEESRTRFKLCLDELLGDTGILLLATQSPTIEKQFCRQRLNFGNASVSSPLALPS